MAVRPILYEFLQSAATARASEPLDDLENPQRTGKLDPAERIVEHRFRPVRVGPLAAARELEAVAWLNIRLQLINGGDWRTSFVLVGAPTTSLAA